MKIAQIVPSLEARHGGPSRSVRGLAEGLHRGGQTVELLTTGPLDSRPTTRTGDLEARSFPRAWPESLARSPSLREHLAAGSHDVVHHHGLWQRPLHYACRSANKARVPFVISPRGMMCDWAWNHHRWKKTLARRFIHPGAFESAAGWHATSEAEVTDIRRLGFKQPVCVAPNGVDCPSPEDETASASHWRSLLPEVSGRRVALFYSRFHEKKRVLELIDLWLAASRGDWILLLVGIPEQYSVDELRARVAQRGGDGRIFVEDGATRPPPYAIASLFLLPSHSENFGLVVAEALVHRVPVLATDTTPWQALAGHGAGDCVDWARFGKRLDAFLAESPDSLRASGERARAWAGAAFSWDHIAKDLIAFYQQLGISR